LACLLLAFILSGGFAILSRYSKLVQYLMMPFVTLARALPTAVLMILIAVFLVPVPALVPIFVSFFVIFPMLYEGINNAVDNIDHKRIEMANVFNVSKWEQFKNIYLPSATPYIFSSLIAGFGLSFKIAIASQLVQTVITKINPDYPSIGMIIAQVLNQGNYAEVIA
jgi:NitT/TauT family transport system permease protein